MQEMPRSDERIVINQNNEIKEKKFKFNWKLEFILIAVFVLLVVFDQLTKWLAVKYLGPLTGTADSAQFGNKITFIPNFIDWNLIINRGSAFGLGDGDFAARILFILISWVTMVGIGVLLYFYRTKIKTGLRILLYLILAGDVGNLIDRTFYFGIPNGVIDFIDVNPMLKAIGMKNPNFGVFNVADAILVCSMIALLIYIIVDTIKDSKHSKVEKNG